jgi:hypothetical protein
MDLANVTQPLHDHIGQLNRQLSEATAAQVPLNNRVADLERQLSTATSTQEALIIEVQIFKGQFLKQYKQKNL